MRIGVISDVHSNLAALEAVYRQLGEAGADRVICLGDMVGYGPDPAACIDFVRAYGITCLKGNHDAFTADTERRLEWELQDYARIMILWTQAQLSTEQLNWLEKLPCHLTMEGIQMVHASLECLSGEYWPYILDQKTAQFHFYLQDSRLAFCGHVHIPLLFTAAKGVIKMEMLNRKRLPKRTPSKFLISPGAVGQPRDMDWRAASAIYDTKTGVVEPLRTEYAVEQVRQKFRRPGMPKIIPERLFRGP